MDKVRKLKVDNLKVCAEDASKECPEITFGTRFTRLVHPEKMQALLVQAVQEIDAKVEKNGEKLAMGVDGVLEKVEKFTKDVEIQRQKAEALEKQVKLKEKLVADMTKSVAEQKLVCEESVQKSAATLKKEFEDKVGALKKEIAAIEEVRKELGKLSADVQALSKRLDAGTKDPEPKPADPPAVPKPAPKPEPKPEPKPAPKPEPKPAPKPEPSEDKKPEPKPEPKPEDPRKDEPKPAPKPAPPKEEAPADKKPADSGDKGSGDKKKKAEEAPKEEPKAKRVRN